MVGFAPLIAETAVGLERMSPLAIAAGAGLLVGTLVTTAVVPVVYTRLDDAGALARRAPRRGRPVAAAEGGTETVAGAET